MDVGRRYGAGAFELLTRFQDGGHWRQASRELTDCEAAVRACVAVGGGRDTAGEI